MGQSALSGGNQSSIMGINPAFQNQLNFKGIIGQEDSKDSQPIFFSEASSAGFKGSYEAGTAHHNTNGTTVKHKDADENLNGLNLREHESIESQRIENHLLQSKDSMNSSAQ